jgi:hypothetical protein
MRHKVFGSGVMALALVAAMTQLQAQNANPEAKAADVLAASHKAIGNNKLDTLKTFSLQAAMQRNLGSMQMQADVEMLLEMPDKYVRTDVTSGMMNMTTSTGFNGEKAIMPAGARAMPGGGMMITMGGPAGAAPHDVPKTSPEEMAQMNKASMRNYRQDISRLMLGWFAGVHPSMKASYVYAGEAESPDGKADVIDVKDDDGFAARLFIDQVSHLPLMVSYQGRQPRVMTSTTRPGGAAPAAGAAPAGAAAPAAAAISDLKTQMAQPAPMVEMSLFFEDWHEADGINFPHKIRRASAGETTEEWTINKIKVNPKIDPKKFSAEGK